MSPPDGMTWHDVAAIAVAAGAFILLVVVPVVLKLLGRAEW